MSLPYLKKRRPMDWPLHCALDWPLTWAIAYVNDIIDAIQKLNPLLATDSNLLNPANAGRPVSGGDVMSFDGASEYVSIPSLVGTEIVVSSAGTSVVSVAAGQLDFTAGTSANVVLDNGNTYYLGETTGSTAYDSSGNGNHGTYVNNPTSLVDNTVGFSAWNQLGGSQPATLISNVPTHWGTSGAYSTAVESGDFEFTHVVSDTVNSYMVGMSADPTIDNNFTNIDFAIYRNLSNLKIWEDGSEVFSEGAVLQAGDILAIQRVGGVVTYKRNGIVRHTSVKDATGLDLQVDSTLSLLGTTVGVSWMQDGKYVEWTNPVGLDITPIRIPRDESNTSFDVLGNVTQWSGSTYPLEPIITGTAESFTVLNSNLADDGNQPPAIFNAGIPAIWTQGDGNIPVLQVKDNGDATSSLGLGLETAPTAPEQVTIDEYHA